MDRLPAELLANIFNYLDDARDWLAIESVCGSFSRTAFAVQRVKMLLSDQKMSSSLVIKLQYLQVIEGPVILREDSELKSLALMRNLRHMTLKLGNVRSLDVFINKIKNFISHYCGQGRNMNDKYFDISAGCKRSDTIDSFFFKQDQDFFRLLRICEVKSPNPYMFMKVDADTMILFIEHYRKYTPLKNFCSANAYNYNREEIRAIGKYLNDVDELDTYILYLYSNSFHGHKLYKLLKDKVITIKTDLSYGDLARDSLFTINLADSNNLRAFHIPIGKGYLSTVIDKYPQLREICIHYRSESVDVLMEIADRYPQLEKIYLYAEVNKPAFKLPSIFSLYE